MGKLADAETAITEKDRYEHYLDMVEAGTRENRDNQVEQIRYMLAIANNASESNSNRDVIFIGGLGVICNLVNHNDEEVILKWRGTRDLDMLVTNPAHHGLVVSAFDEVDIDAYSHSIKNKKTVRGYSVDANYKKLSSTTADVYIPPTRISDGVNAHGFLITDGVIERCITTDFFGVPVTSLSPLDLLEMKLRTVNNVVKCNGVPRIQDCEDIANLLGVLEDEGQSVADFKKRVPYHVRQMIEVSQHYVLQQQSDPRERVIVRPSNNYTREAAA